MSTQTIAWTRLDGLPFGLDARTIEHIIERESPAAEGDEPRGLDLARHLELATPSGARRGFRLGAGNGCDVWAGTEVWLSPLTEPVFELPALVRALGARLGITGVTAIGARVGYLLDADVLRISARAGRQP